jgi:hypothetical protein
MPRLAPVSSSVRRGWLLVWEFAINDLLSRIHPNLGPHAAERAATELHPVM